MTRSRLRAAVGATVLLGAALAGTAVADTGPRVEAGVGVQPRDYLLCLWDVPNELGGICLPGLDPIIALVEALLGGGLLAGGFSL